MKILHVVQSYAPVIGGTEYMVQQLSERLVRDYGDEVTVFTTTAAESCELFWLKNAPFLPAGDETIHGVRVRRFAVFNRWGRARHLLSQLADKLNWPYQDWLRALFNGPLIFNMTQAIADHPAEVIMASAFPFLHMYYALWGGQRSGKPVALFGALHPTAAWSFDRPMMYQAIHQAEAYIANTTFERDYLLQRNVSPSKIQVIGTAVDLADFAQADGAAIRQKYGWQEAQVVGYVGNLANRKRVKYLLQAMLNVWQYYPHVRLLLAGGAVSSHYLAELEAIIAPVRDKVVIIRNFTDIEKANLYATCDVLVNPSIEESFGIVFLEAWACGKVVIGMRAGAIASVISHQKDGLLVEPDNLTELAQSIITLLNNNSYRDDLGRAGYQKVKQNYTWTVVTRKFRQLYQQLTHPQ